MILGMQAAGYVERLVVERTVRPVLGDMLATLADAEIAAGLGQDMTPAGVAANATVTAALIAAVDRIAAGLVELRELIAEQGGRELDRAEAEIGL